MKDFNQLHQISIFDLDQTLFTDNSSFRFGIYLYRKGILSLSALFFIFGCNFRYKLGWLTIAGLHQSAFNRLFLGRNAELISGQAETFLDEFFDRLIYLPAFKKLQEAKQAGHVTIILSSSPSFLVEPIAKRFKVDRWDATHYSVDKNSCFSDISQLMLGEDKAQYIEQLLQLGASRKNITAYSDSHVDLPFLQAAGNAIGVNPNSKLKAICKEKCWTII